MVSKIRNILKENILLLKVFTCCTKIRIALIGEYKWEKKAFKRTLGYTPNFKNPQTLNEKMAWLKLNYFQPFYLECCDKYLLHSYLEKKIGKDIAPRLIFVTQDPSELTYENIKEFPCIIKTSNGSGTNLIVEFKGQYTEAYIQHLFAKFIVLSDLHTTKSREHQYDIDKPYIVIESLLHDSKGDIPNDYKFLYLNGKLEFIYCSIDRCSANVRQVYDSEWNRLHFVWVAGANEQIYKRYDDSPSIEPPSSFEKMKIIGEELAKDFPLVRIDFYDAVEGLFIGEITLHHGSAHDRFFPEQYDAIFGKKLQLPKKNR